ncbi:hypothetical protein [Streptomyces triticiradicis]|uniref:Secreted protein n=1 Tax=Streptomyces triticiradicis TaxID=2651189 RepID=A0A7J5DHY8_9ACTN|nr:hypothetical protein [Streptomyces triticiradicis]KAB1988251.1 hypothetical protein F8144_13620 [Streptomyces triticiradicis]
MDAFVPFAVMFGGLAAVLGLFARLAVRVRSRGLAGGAANAALASYEEAFRATSHAAHVEIQTQKERKAPLLSPDGHWEPASDGRSPARLQYRRPPARSRLRRSLRRRAGRFRSGR